MYTKCISGSRIIIVRGSGIIKAYRGRCNWSTKLRTSRQTRNQLQSCDRVATPLLEKHRVRGLGTRGLIDVI